MSDGDNNSSATSSQSVSADEAVAPKEQSRDVSGRTIGGDEEMGASADAEIGLDAVASAKVTSTTFKWNPIDQKKAAKKKSLNKKTKGGEKEGNELSHLIPGYTAPMRLEVKSLKGITGQSLSELRKRAVRGDSTIHTPPISILGKKDNTTSSFNPKKIQTPSSIAIQQSTGRKIPTSFGSSFHKNVKKQNDSTAGSGWFNMNPTPMSNTLKTDLAIIRNRNYLDPKKFYKSSDTFEGKVLQVGTVIEGSAEFYSSRLARKDRRQNLTEEIMADVNVSNYAKRKYYEVQAGRASKKSLKGGGGKRGRSRR